jgi:hypothetical protein
MFRKSREARGLYLMKLDGIANINSPLPQCYATQIYLESPFNFPPESGRFRTYPVRRIISLSSKTAKQIVEILI